ncbi:MAG TPA: apolipoprotein N-acyltransferase [Jatrophihabitans sp.]|jgi:apolipoprotein N-acyltransferase
MRIQQLARSVLPRLLLVVAGGTLGAIAFPQLGVWPLSFVSVAALSIAVEGCRSRRGAWLGFAYGLAFFVPLLHWTGIYVGAFPWLLLAVGEAAFFALLGAALPVLQRLRAAPLWVAAAWVLEEFFRDRLPFGGFPWGRLAFSQSESPLRWFAALGGAPLVTFVVAAIGAFLAEALRHVGGLEISRRRRIISVVVAAAIFGCAFGVGDVLEVRRPGGENHGLKIALIQGNVPSAGLTSEARAREVLDYHVQQTMKLVQDVKAGRAQQPDLVLWPEDASDVDPFRDPIAYQEIDETVKAVGVPILVGAIRYTSDAADADRYNVGILWSPTTGPGAEYAKRHPVPFGEYIPLRSISDRVSSAAKLVTNQMLAGKGNGLVNGAAVPLGDVICFEVAYDSLVRSSVKAGAQLLVVQTNNATFGHTAETYQQLAMTKLRAVETGRTVMQVATTGKSAVIDPNGRVLTQSGALYTPDTLQAGVYPRTAMTLAMRLGSWPEYILSLLAALALAWSVRAPLGRSLPWRRRRAVTAPPDGVTTDAEPSEMVRT